jgi:hypothetical protein
MVRLFRVAVLLSILPIFAHAQSRELVTLKQSKKSDAPHRHPDQYHLSQGCETCQAAKDPEYAHRNAREVILAFRIPRSTPISLFPLASDERNG